MIKKYFSIIVFLIASSLLAQQTITLTSADIKAFPGAIGHGNQALVSSRPNAVYFVTNTNDGTGAGTFRKALSDASTNGSGYIIFRTGGVLTYTTDPDIDDNIYIAGQTAPGGGYGVRAANDARHQIWVRGSNNIVRHLRFYGGDFNGQDCLTIGDTDTGRATDMNNVIIDKNSFHWGEDENVAFTHYTTAGAGDLDAWSTPKWYMRNMSFTRNLVGEQYGSGYGMILYGSGKEDFSIIGNLFINHADRSPLNNGVSNEWEYINNLQHYGDTFSTIKGHPQQKANLIGNVHTPRIALTNETYRFIDCSTDNCPPSGFSNYTGTEVYYTDNIDYTNTNDAADYNTNMSTYLQGGVVSAIASDYIALSSTGAVNFVLDEAGAGVGTTQGRDALDLIQIADYNAGTGRYTQSLSRTPPSLAAGTPYTDADGDGLSDAYETANGGDVNPFTQPSTATLVDGRVIDQSTATPGQRYNHMDIFLAELADDWGNTPTPPAQPTQGNKRTFNNLFYEH